MDMTSFYQNCAAEWYTGKLLSFRRKKTRHEAWFFRSHEAITQRSERRQPK
jgi:hypothetical protein